METDWQYANMLRVRAWYCIFNVATGAANALDLPVLRDRLLEALKAVDMAIEADGK